MAQAIQPQPIPARAWRAAAVVVAGALAVGGLLKVLDPTRVAAAQNFFLILASLLIEAVPFVLLGALVSAAIEVFVPSRFFERIERLPKPMQLPAAGMAGMA